MTSLTQDLAALFGAAFAAQDVDSAAGQVAVSSRPDLGDFQCNGALQAARDKRMNPRALAQAVVDALPPNDLIAEVSLAGPGFINIRVADDALARHVDAMAHDARLGVPVVAENGAVPTIMIDYGGPNVAKPLHVGHLRAGIIGQALVNLFTALGYQVIGDAHLGDWGKQMGMLICELARRRPDLVYFDAAYTGPYPQESPVTIDDLAEMYPLAAARAKEDPAEDEAARLATVDLQQGRPGYRALWQHFRDVSVADLSTDYRDLGIDFHYWLGESDAQPIMPQLVEELQRAHFAHVSDGAIVMDVADPDDKKELPPLMLVKSDGAVLYGTSDLATILQRVRDFNPDAILYVVDKRQSLHFRQVFRAAYKAGVVRPDVALEHIAFGTMNGKDGRPFKTRAGGVMQLKDLRRMVKEAALARMAQTDVAADYDDEERERIARMVGLAALKFGDLVNHYTTDYVFDLERFLEFEGRTGPYLLYATVRTLSILRKAEEQGVVAGPLLAPEKESERALLLKLTELPDVLRYAAETRAPNHLCEYVYTLSGAFNRFYAECHILREENAARQASWLALSRYFVQVMETTLGILGIEVPERM